MACWVKVEAPVQTRGCVCVCGTHCVLPMMKHVNSDVKIPALMAHALDSTILLAQTSLLRLTLQRGLDGVSSQQVSIKKGHYQEKEWLVTVPNHLIQFSL